ncbi:MAG: 30S ribosomal protein S20 [bacterium]
MAHTKSAKKRARTSAEKQASNRAARSLMKNLRKKLLEAVAAKDPAASDAALRAFFSGLDKSAKGGVITKNNAIRRKTRAANLVRSIRK